MEDGNGNDREREPRPGHRQADEIGARPCQLDSACNGPTPRPCNQNQSKDSNDREMSTDSNEELPMLQTSVPENVEEKGDSSDDDELEVLLVIQPPTPKRPKPSRERKFPPPTSHQQDAVQCCSDPDPGTIVTPFTQRRTDSPDNCTKQEQRAEPAPVVDPMTNTSFSQYTYQTSAYVQNLAEICHTMLWDRRWRVGASRSRLLEWERGDDLSAVLSLSRLFIKNESTMREKREPCRCLLCRLKTKEQTTGEMDTCPSEVVVDDEEKTTVDKTNDKLKGPSPINTVIDEDEARALHLYCRLFYRKGPWFRLDDVYARYYAPSKKRSRSDTSTSTESNNDVANEASEKAEKNTFFRPKRNGSKRSASPENLENDKNSVNEETQRTLSLLFRDVTRLCSMGLIRSFRNEEECGKTVGEVHNDRKWSLLTAEERSTLLSKLGGGPTKSKQQSRRMSSISENASTDGSGRKHGASNPRENQVWKQMCRQQSIAGQISGKSEQKILLPVKRHVTALLLDKLATKAVLSTCPEKSLPSSTMKEQVSQTKRAIQRIVKSENMAKDELTDADLNMCIRLREAPLLSLRRFTRLYLCATHGPGNMRGDGSNGWMGLSDSSNIGISHRDLPMLHLVKPPGSHTWHNISYPSLMHRFGISTCTFTQAYRSLPVSSGESCPSQPSDVLDKVDDSVAGMEVVFSSYCDFQTWELCAEIRANVDYLIEVNDLIHYYERRKARESATLAGASQGVEESESNCDGCQSPASEADDQCPAPSVVDFLSVLTLEGRARILEKLLRWYASGTEAAPHLIKNVEAEVESAISSLAGPSVVVSKESESEAQSSASSAATARGLENDCEKVICVIAIIAAHVLAVRHKWVSPSEISLKKARPWLRHMWWDGNLAYVLWDCIPLLERRGYYSLALKGLEVLLFGSASDSGSSTAFPSATDVVSHWTLRSSSLASIWISRRARGKAYDRLIIDYTHILRMRAKEIAASAKSVSNGDEPSSKKRERKRKDAPRKDSEPSISPQEMVTSVCSQMLPSLAVGSIPFSAIRSLARRVKRPLADTLGSHWCLEAFELGLRLDNPAEDGSKEEKAKGYRDWAPETDYAVANAIEGETTELGKRCSFVGFEDEGTDAVTTSSLNVEELAMEFYGSGRLPSEGQADTGGPLGGWVGWHDEGGHLRALFRIICCTALLGVDLGCETPNRSSLEELENATIFLTPYQGAPMDLHVGHAMTRPDRQDGVGDNQIANAFVRGFYQRQRGRMDLFLTHLESLGRQQLSDLVYDSVAERLRNLGSRPGSDTTLQRDLLQLRTLSMLAAGFGGKLLSAAFRCLLFDYRHYSGGLPDLLLVRACYEGQEEAVDLGDWIGEAFSKESQEEEEMSKRVSLLCDKDDEFLGCSKMGDTAAGQSSGRWDRQRSSFRRNGSQDDRCVTPDDLPQKLILVHNSRNIQVQCMFVEVKSSNDRLDSRQEDWLNVLDKHGNARVCKFLNGKKNNRRGKKK